jgi:hypothetical protein
MPACPNSRLSYCHGLSFILLVALDNDLRGLVFLVTLQDNSGGLVFFVTLESAFRRPESVRSLQSAAGSRNLLWKSTTAVMEAAMVIVGLATGWTSFGTRRKADGDRVQSVWRRLG